MSFIHETLFFVINKVKKRAKRAWANVITPIFVSLFECKDTNNVENIHHFIHHLCYSDRHCHAFLECPVDIQEEWSFCEDTCGPVEGDARQRHHLCAESGFRHAAQISVCRKRVRDDVKEREK